jgi:hypothetical protein
MEGSGESIRDLLLRYYRRIRLEELCQYVKNAFSVGIKLAEFRSSGGCVSCKQARMCWN